MAADDSVGKLADDVTAGRRRQALAFFKCGHADNIFFSRDFVVSLKKGRRRVLEAIFVRQWRTLGLRASWDRYTVGAKRRAGRVGVVVFAAVLLLLLLQQLLLLRVSCSIGGATRRGPRVAMRVMVTCRCALESIHLAQRAVVRDGAKTKWEREQNRGLYISLAVFIGSSWKFTNLPTAVLSNRSVTKRQTTEVWSKLMHVARYDSTRFK